MLSELEAILVEQQPDWTVVYGDTNSTVAGALAAVKINLPVAHLEAGLRSFNRNMPEEHNRVLTDHAADLLLAPTDVAMQNLANEGLADRSVLVGDVMADICLQSRETVGGQRINLPDGVDPSEPYVVATLHRPSNTDNQDRLRQIVDVLRDLTVPVVLVAHPRLIARASGFGIKLNKGALRTSPPLAYLQMIRAIIGSVGVVTDSGGLQKEAYLLERPCTTLRSETEWVETLDGGWNILDPGLTQLASMAVRPPPILPQSAPFGTGQAARKVVDELWRYRT